MKDETLRERIKRLREAIGMTQAELASEASMKPGTIGDLESGRQHGTAKFDLLATALRVSSDYLRDGKESKRPTILESTLTDRESRLITKFRSISENNKQRIEDFIAGIAVRSPGKQRPRVSRPEETTAVPREQRRRSG
jgi:transcriptional regulator with XRE-family HTH domain